MEVFWGNEDVSSRGIYCVLMPQGESKVTTAQQMNARHCVLTNVLCGMMIVKGCLLRQTLFIIAL